MWGSYVHFFRMLRNTGGRGINPYHNLDGCGMGDLEVLIRSDGVNPLFFSTPRLVTKEDWNVLMQPVIKSIMKSVCKRLLISCRKWLLLVLLCSLSWSHKSADILLQMSQQLLERSSLYTGVQWLDTDIQSTHSNNWVLA